VRASVKVESKLRKHPWVASFLPLRLLESLLPIPQFPFNGDFARQKLLRDLTCGEFAIAIETGTHYGATTTYLREVLPCRVVSVENDSFFKLVASRRIPDLASSGGIILGDSTQVLGSLCPARQALFYLDAHWGSSPRLKELEIIMSSWKDFVVLIDDVFIPELALSGARYGGVPFDIASILSHVSSLDLGQSLAIYKPSREATETYQLDRGWLILTDRDEIMELLDISEVVEAVE
jgi:hypothetical protein